jgi:hypothetical protein
VAVITGGRFARGVQKALGIKGEIVIPDLDSALQAGIEILDQPLDQRVLFGWREYGLNSSQAGAAANISAFILQNPPNSGIIALVERVEATIAAANDELGLLIGAFPNQGAGGNRGNLRDSRGGKLLAGSNCTLRGLNNPTTLAAGAFAKVFPSLFGATKTYFHTVVGAVGDDTDSYLLAPGDQISFETLSANVTLDMSMWWRERAIDPSELTA